MEISDNSFKLYKVRWYVLFVTAMATLIGNAQWLQYSIIADILVLYYGVSYNAVNWTSLIYLLVYFILVFPLSYLLDKYGIRYSMVFGAIGTAAGAWIKVCSVSTDRYWVLLLGQLVVAVASVPFMGLAPKVPAVWFGPNEVSTACGIGLAATQLGIGIGFAFPTLISSSQTDVTVIQNDLSTIALSVAIVSTILAVTVIIYCPDKPKTPPSQAALESLDQQITIWKTLKSLITNRVYVIILIACSIQLGICCTISALLNQIVLRYYLDGLKDAGRIGILMVISGFIGSLLAGFILDKYKAYKASLTVMGLVLLFSLILFTCTASMHIALIYIFIGLVGLSFGAIWSISFEVAVEATYPAPEATVDGLINGIGQASGVCFTELYSMLFYKAGTVWANVSQIILAVLAVILVACVKIKYNRKAANFKTTITKEDYKLTSNSIPQHVSDELKDLSEKMIMHKV